MTPPEAVDDSEILVPGPWRHRFVAANGARFHVAEAGSGPLVLLLHGFPDLVEGTTSDRQRVVAPELVVRQSTGPAR